VVPVDDDELSGGKPLLAVRHGDHDPHLRVTGHIDPEHEDRPRSWPQPGPGRHAGRSLGARGGHGRCTHDAGVADQEPGHRGHPDHHCAGSAQD
jgi:hypothetical protein